MAFYKRNDVRPPKKSSQRPWDRDGFEIRFRRLSILIAEIMAPLFFVSFVSNFVVGSPWMLEKLDRYRPGRPGISTTTNVEKQMLHIEADARLNHATPKVIFIGTSSVVNGIDVNLIKAMWHENGFARTPVNYGLTGLMAYELPFLKKHLMTPEVEAIVFLYNTFCFSDVIHPQAASIRFNTYEFIRNSVWRKASPDQFFKGIWSEVLFVVRYRGVLKELLYRLSKGRLEELAYAYDFEPGRPARGLRERRMEKPANHWLRNAYVTSDTDRDTISYRGFRRFLDLSEAARKNVVIAAMPVPDFARTNRFRVGVNHDRIDARIEKIAQSRGLLMIERKLVRAIERDDNLFWDRIHLHDGGRTLFSMWLAMTLPELIRRN
jgi:hypothetical protein